LERPSGRSLWKIPLEGLSRKPLSGRPPLDSPFEWYLWTPLVSPSQQSLWTVSLGGPGSSFGPWAGLSCLGRPLGGPFQDVFCTIPRTGPRKAPRTGPCTYGSHTGIQTYPTWAQGIPCGGSALGRRGTIAVAVKVRTRCHRSYRTMPPQSTFLSAGSTRPTSSKRPPGSSRRTASAPTCSARRASPPSRGKRRRKWTRGNGSARKRQHGRGPSEAGFAADGRASKGLAELDEAVFDAAFSN
jgi:hypothetical protein